MHASDVLLTERKYQVILRTWESLGSLKAPLIELRRSSFKGISNLSGDAIGVDAADPRYHHLLGMHAETGELFGAYRLFIPPSASGANEAFPVIVEKLFDARTKWPDLVSKGIELGRAVVAIEAQKNYAPLLLLWRGIAKVFASHPECSYAYGPVTLPHDFPPEAVKVLQSYLNLRHSNSTIATVEPLFPLAHPTESIETSDVSTFDSFHSLDNYLRACFDGVRTPVLVRQYARFGALFSKFGRWPDFGDSPVALAVLPVSSARRQLID